MHKIAESWPSTTEPAARSCPPQGFWSSALMGSGPLGPWKISPRRHTRALAALARSWPRHSLPTAEGAEPGAWGLNGTVGSAAVLLVGSGDSELRSAHASHRPPLPAPARSRLRRAPEPPLAGPEGPGRPLPTTGHIRRPWFLSAVVTEGQRLAPRKRPESVTRRSKGVLTGLPGDPPGNQI